MDVVREVTPLTNNDCFAIFSREKDRFDFPLHNHDHIEINLILNAPGAQRIVGNHTGEIEERELVCIGPNLAHGWFNHHCHSKKIKEVTIQFQSDLFDDNFLRKNQLENIRSLFEDAKRGISFTRPTIDRIAPRIMELHKKQGFESVIELLSILNDLSISKDARLLSDAVFITEDQAYASRRIEQIFNFLNNNFHKQVTLAEAAAASGMAYASFSRFIKLKTGSSFVEILNGIRLGHVSRMLIDTTQTIAEIAYKCGFNNIANFNRTFKNNKGLTPSTFRESYLERLVFI